MRDRRRGGLTAPLIRRAAALPLAALIVVACQATSPTPTRVVWRERVPTPDPSVVAAQPVVAQGSKTVTLQPISPTGAQVGVDYGYDMPHCGLGSPIDVDGSFWDSANTPPDPVDFDGQSGSFRLTSSTTATFTSTDGRVLHLVRHSGAKEFFLCL